MRVEHPVFRPRAMLGATLGLALLSLSGEAALAQMQQHTLPLVLPHGTTNQGFVRIINHSDRAGTVTVHGIDDAGKRYGPISFNLAANATKHLNSGDLEQGNAGKGLSAGLGDGEGDWRLELTTELDIEPLAYIRTSAGFLTSMHDVVQPEYVPRTPGADDYMRHQVRFFNPGRNSRQVSRLRVINTTGVDNPVSITGVDDAGDPAPGGKVTLTLSPYQARTITAQQLENGADFLAGSLRTGTGKWQLTVTPGFQTEADRRSVRPIQVMSLLFSRETGNLANLSAVGDGNDSNRGGDGTDWLWGGAGDDILNPGDNDDNYDGVYGSEGTDTIIYTDSGPSAFQWLGYEGLKNGIRATINGVTNVGTVDKGASGTDTIADVENPLNAAMNSPPGAFGMGGTHYDDRFDITLADGQWMDVRGEAGNDTINIVSGSVQVNYRHSPGPVSVDLAAGRASNDGYGSSDTLIGTVYRIEGGPGGDTLLGTDGFDRFDGGPGDDTINPRGSDWRIGCDHVRASPGNDRIVFSDAAGPRVCVTLEYARIDPGGITATIDGAANRATVDKGAHGTDTVVDVANMLRSGGSFGFQGSTGADTIDVTLAPGQWVQVRGNAGNDAFLFDVRSEENNYSSARLDYTWPRTEHGVDVDLAAGRANDDGFGDVDTITGNLWEVRGTDYDDVIRGSDADESFIGRGGNDTIDGRGGYDRLRFDRSGIGDVSVDLDAGTVRGTWGSGAFAYTIANIERVHTGPGDDSLTGGPGDDRLHAGAGSDLLEGGAGNDRLYAGDDGEADFFLFGPGHGEDRIYEFGNGDDVIVLIGLGVTKAEVLDNAHAWSEGVGIWIDLRPFGGGTISISGLPRSDLDESDFLL